MEAEELSVNCVHHGHNIRRTRIEKKIKQDALSELVNMSQSNISKYECSRVIDDEILHRFARALDVPFEYLKNLEENAPSVVFENNTVNNSDHASGNSALTYDGTNNNTFNPIEKITELLDKNTELYERLLKEKDEKYAALERRLESVERSLGK